MPIFTFPTGESNVVSSLNKFFKDQINVDLPAWKSTAFGVVYDYPDVPLFDEASGDYAPKFSVSYLGDFDESVSSGDLLDRGNRGQKVYGICEINCWVNGKTSAQVVNSNWPRDLRSMRDMVVKLFSANRVIPILDRDASITVPAPTGYIVRVDRVERPFAPADPNPNIKRRRLLVHYSYHQRQ